MLGQRNQLTLPKEFVPEGTSFFQCERRADGAIVLVPQIAVPAQQAWFWTRRWQEGERKASEDIQAGRLTRHDSAQELIAAITTRRKGR